jgi:hypothetical protein
MAYGAALHRRYVRPVGIDLHLMVITDEEEWNTGPAHIGVATDIRGDDRVVADSAALWHITSFAAVRKIRTL